VTDMLHEFYRGTSQAIEFTVIAGQAEFIGLLTLLQATCNTNVATRLAALLRIGCKAEQAYCAEENQRRNYQFGD